MKRILLLSSLLTVGLSVFQFRQAQAEVTWKSNVAPKARPSPLIWESISKPKEHNKSESKVEAKKSKEDKTKPKPKKTKSPIKKLKKVSKK